MSRQPLHQNLNVASLHSVIYLDIIWEGTNRHESLMSGEPDLSSLPADITLNRKKMVQCSVWPPWGLMCLCGETIADNRYDWSEVQSPFLGSEWHEKKILSEFTECFVISSSAFQRPKLRRKVESDWSTTFLLFVIQLFLMHVKQALKDICHLSYKPDLGLFIQYSTSCSFYESWLESGHDEDAFPRFKTQEGRS